MAESLKRIAAGAGVAIAITMAGGPGVAIATADCGEPHSGAGWHGRPHGQGPRDHALPGRGAVEPEAPEVVGRPGSAAEAAPEPPPTLPAVKPAAVRRGGSANPRVVGQPPHHTPIATFGNGRTPAAPTISPDRLADPVVQAVVPTTTLAQGSRPPQAPAPISRPALPRVVLMESPLPPAPPVEAFAGTFVGVPPEGWPAGVLFGIAGLVLAPIGGVWLGHRQARAARAASQFVSR